MNTVEILSKSKVIPVIGPELLRIKVVQNGNQYVVQSDGAKYCFVVIATYDVRQSGFTGGGINAVTKSGTNTYKGSAYSYFRNQDLVGRGANGQAISDQTAQTYGATFGGPIVKDKLFTISLIIAAGFALFTPLLYMALFSAM